MKKARVILTAAHCREHDVKTCSRCISDRLTGKPGIHDLQVIDSNNDSINVIVDYDPQVITLAGLEREAHCSSMTLPETIVHMVVPLDGIRSIYQSRAMENDLNELAGVSAAISYPASSLRLEFDRNRCALPEIVNRLEKRGIIARFQDAVVESHDTTPATLHVEQITDRQHKSPGLANRIFAWIRGHIAISFVAAGGLMLLAGLITNWLQLDQSVTITLLAISAACSSVETIKLAWDSLKNLRLNIDMLMFAAAAGACLIGHYEEAALLLFLFGLGTAGEHLALSRARHAITTLSQMTPQYAQRLDHNQRELAVHVNELAVDDRIIIKPFDRIPVDGLIRDGESGIDESAITGEATPVDKSVDQPVFAGSINGQGRLIVQVTRLARDSTINRIIKMVEEAQTTKSPTQLFTDRVEQWYVPIVFAATILLFALPPIMMNQAWSLWFYRAMAFLTAASPCALAIGTPSAMLCGISHAAGAGVLIKGGLHLEAIGQIDTIAFDKTGTLTTGKPLVLDIIATGNQSNLNILQLAASLERHSNHPIAQAIVRESRSKNIEMLDIDDVSQIAGIGCRGRYNHTTLQVGQVGLIHELPGEKLEQQYRRRIDELAGQGKTIVVVAQNNNIIGLIALADHPRPNALSTLQQIRKLGVRRTIMLTGDHQPAAAYIARQTGVDDYHADLMPEDKLALVRQLVDQGNHIAMVGDGVNDGPALAAADIGIAMGETGNSVAMETADIILMGNRLEQLPQTITLSRKAHHIIMQNLVIAIGTIAVVAPLAAAGFANLALAVTLHEGSTILVVLNALRLLRK